jgi:hypothetical protein
MRSSAAQLRFRCLAAFVVRRITPAATVALLVLAATVLSPGLGRDAHADESAGAFFGFVARDANGALPTKVRALGSAVGTDPSAICGTADIQVSGEAAGFYLLTVASNADRVGCPAAGDQVRFLLLYGAVDPGTIAPQSGFWAATAQRVDLAPSELNGEVGAFVGALPAGEGYALLQWRGMDRTPIARAVATIDRRVVIVILLGRNGSPRYIPGEPSPGSDLQVVNNGDVVVVLVK